MYIGIDIGGTGIQMGIVNEMGSVLNKYEIKTNKELSFEEQLNKIVDAIYHMLDMSCYSISDIHAIGAGVPGLIDLTTGYILKCTNIGWFNVPFKSRLEEQMNCSVYIDNDANAAALAESIAGSSHGFATSVMMTLGTGIGSGIIIDGKIWRGSHCIGSELGHIILVADGIPCSCGNKGCLERYCSASAIIRMAREELLHRPESMIIESAGSFDKINAQIIIDCAKQNDPVATDIFQQYVHYLSMAVANVINLLDPDIIVLGGGVSNAGSYLLNAVQSSVTDFVVNKSSAIPKIAIASLGSEAGIIGAAMLGRKISV